MAIFILSQSVKTLFRIEEWAKFLASYLGSLYLGFDWWLFPVLILLPDLSMLGYLINLRLGAATYNLFHHQALAIVLGVTGVSLGIPYLQLAGIILFGHSALDRALGYGLKYSDSFQHTHLGWIGKKNHPL